MYWNDASFQEYSYVTGADSAEMGQGGMRVNMVPRDGGNTFRGTFMANFANEGMASDNCNSPGIGQACTQQNLWGDLTYNANNKLTNISQIQDVWDINPTIGGPIMRDRLWFNYTFRHWGVNKSVADSYADLDPSPFRYTPTSRTRASTTGTSSATRPASRGRSRARTRSRTTTTTSASTATTGASPPTRRPRPPACRSRPRASSA